MLVGDAAVGADHGLLRQARESNTKGYASPRLRRVDGYQPSNLVKLDILLVGQARRRAFDFIVHRDKAYDRGRVLAEKPEGHHPAVRCSRCPSRPPSAAACIARQTVNARSAKTCSPNATAATSRRKRKLLEKQKAGQEAHEEPSASRGSAARGVHGHFEG